MRFGLIHLDSYSRKDALSYLDGPLAGYDMEDGRWHVHKSEICGRLGFLPLAEERSDEMSKMPEDDRINYASLYSMREGKSLPDDLTVTESVLTGLLWGEISRTKAVLLVAALENMDTASITGQLDEMGLF